MNDIYDGIASIRLAFMAAKLNPPSTILLGSHEDGMKFLSSVRQQNRWIMNAGSPDLGRVIKMADGSAWMEVEIMGIKIRWPANRTASIDGTWTYT